MVGGWFEAQLFFRFQTADGLGSDRRRSRFKRRATFGRGSAEGMTGCEGVIVVTFGRAESIEGSKETLHGLSGVMTGSRRQGERIRATDGCIIGLQLQSSRAFCDHSEELLLRANDTVPILFCMTEQTISTSNSPLRVNPALKDFSKLTNRAEYAVVVGQNILNGQDGRLSHRTRINAYKIASSAEELDVGGGIHELLRGLFGPQKAEHTYTGPLRSGIWAVVIYTIFAGTMSEGMHPNKRRERRSGSRERATIVSTASSAKVRGSAERSTKCGRATEEDKSFGRGGGASSITMFISTAEWSLKEGT